MKRCGMCNRTYADDSLSFCLEDGTPLVRDTGGQFNAQATLVAPNVNTAPQGPPQTNPLNANQSAPQQWSQPTQPQFAVPPRQQSSSRLPWILGGAALLLFGIIGLGAVAALVLSSSSGGDRGKPGTNVARPVVSNTKSSGTTTNNNNGSNSDNSNDEGTSYAAREGTYTGTATNTTNSPEATGDAEIELSDYSDATGAFKMKMKFSNGLCGAGESFGVIDKSTGETSLFGSLTTGGTGCAEATWIMTTQCTFPGTDSLHCTYRLTSVGQATQTGKFEVSKQ
jgi:hypothetical protein